jgi:hypothetical protein
MMSSVRALQQISNIRGFFVFGAERTIGEGKPREQLGRSRQDGFFLSTGKQDRKKNDVLPAKMANTVLSYPSRISPSSSSPST